MTFLPIAERELRVAARKRSTIWSRVVSALVAFVIGAGFLMMNAAVGASPVSFGRGLFATLTWLALAATLATGLFFTADSLSEEKREGTLGFLFLTDLRGYDVVGGKLLATSVRGFFALLAFFPVLATTLLMGGVTGAQFWKSSLALVNALFCSLSAGLLASSLSRDSQRAMAGTLLLLLLTCAGGPLLDSVLTALGRTGFHPLLSLASPVYVFWGASAWGRTGYWTGLLASHLLAWAAFALSCWFVPRTWQDRPATAPGLIGSRAYAWKYGRTRTRTVRRERLISSHPVLWLALRERWQSAGAWVLAGLVLFGFVAISLSLPSIALAMWSRVSWFVLIVLYLWTTSHACRFFVDARRSGLLELLLVTPLSSKDIVLGQWRALLRLFGLPVLAVILIEFIGSGFSQQATLGRFKATAGAYGPSLSLNLLTVAAGGLSTVANMAALMWFGMWMGLSSKNASLATLRSILFVQVLPWFGISFASVLFAGLFMSSFVATSPSSSWVMIFPAIIAGLSMLMTIAKDVAFVAWARGRLFTDFRTEATKALNARAAGPLRQGPIPIPPAIASQR